jgi:hypothetical protein
MEDESISQRVLREAHEEQQRRDRESSKSNQTGGTVISIGPAKTPIGATLQLLVESLILFELEGGGNLPTLIIQSFTRNPSYTIALLVGVVSGTIIIPLLSLALLVSFKIVGYTDNVNKIAWLLYIFCGITIVDIANGAGSVIGFVMLLTGILGWSLILDEAKERKIR